MEYPKYQLTEPTAIQEAHRLVKEGVYAFLIYRNENLLMGVNLYKNSFWGRAMKSFDTIRYIKENPEIWDAYYEHCKGILDYHRGWREHRKGFSYFYLFNYLSKKEFGSEIGRREADIREHIYDFKYDVSRGKTLEDHKNGVDFFAPKVERVLTWSFMNAQNDIVFMCVPASTSEKYERRTADFAERVCKRTGMVNAMPHVKYVKDGTVKHSGGKERAQVELDKEFFNGKKVVLFDDVITSGGTMKKSINDVVAAGGCVLGAVCLGKTVYNKELAHPYDNF